MMENKQTDLEYFEWNMNHGGGFMQSIIGAMWKADSQNLQRLQKGFPRLVNGYVRYSHDTDWDGFIQMLQDHNQEIID